MKKQLLGKLNNTKGSSLPEALVGFLIAVLTSMILVGVVTTSGNIMITGQEALDIVYGEQRALDVFVHHDYSALYDTDTDPDADSSFSTFEQRAGDDFSRVQLIYNVDDSGDTEKTVFVLQDAEEAEESAYPVTETSVVYCQSVKHKVLCFTTPPDRVFAGEEQEEDE